MNQKRFFCFLLLVCFSIHASSENGPGTSTQPPCIHKMLRHFVDEMRRDHGLVFAGEGGKIPSEKVEAISLLFWSFHEPTVEEARELEVTAIERLTKLMNENEKIRPLLSEYPFSQKNVYVSIAFKTKKGTPLSKDGTVSLVFRDKDGSILYDRSKTIIIPPQPEISPVTKEVVGFGKESAKDEYYTFHQETYGHALQIVQASSQAGKKKTFPSEIPVASRTESELFLEAASDFMRVLDVQIGL